MPSHTPPCARENLGTDFSFLTSFTSLCICCSAECRLKRGEEALAKEDCDAALQADPTFVKAFFRRAKAQLLAHAGGGGRACGALQGARRDLEEAVRLDEDCEPAWGLLRDVKAKSEEEYSFRYSNLVVCLHPGCFEH